MKILHIIQRYPPAIGGAETWCQRVCRYFSNHGHDVTVLTLNVFNEEEFWIEPPVNDCMLRFGACEYDGAVKVIRCKRTKIPRALFAVFKAIDSFFNVYLFGPHSVAMFLRMPGEISRADIVHLHTIPYPHNILGLLIGKCFRKRIVLTPHFHIGNRQFESRFNFWLMKQCDAVFAVTQREKEYLVSRGLSREKVAVAYNAVDPAEFCPSGLKAFRLDVYAKYGIDERTRAIVFIGRKIEYKGLETLIDAVRALRTRLPIVLFLIGPDFAWFQKFYADLPPEEKEYIIDFGIVPHATKVNLLHMSDILVLPSQFEAFGIVFLEAWACGIPVIGARTDVSKEVLDNAGLAFAHGNSRDLSAAIERLLTDDELRAKLADSGRRKVNEKFGIEAVGKQIYSTLTAVVDNDTVLKRRIREFAFTRAAMDKIARGSLHINWFVTWHCNYHCQYCWEEVGKRFYRMSHQPWVPAEEWAGAFNRLKPRSIDMTGGEPTLYPHWMDFINMLAPGIIVTMTTNLGPTFDEAMFVKRMKPLAQGGSIAKMALSFHPTQADFEDFLGKARCLKDNGFDLQINYVLHPVQMWQVKEYQDKFRYHGIEMHIEPFVAPSEAEGGTPVFLTEKEMEWTRMWVSSSASPKNEDRLGKQQFMPGTLNNADEDMKKSWGVDRRPVLCDAGRIILTVDYNGDAYTCVSGLTRSRIFGLNALPHYAPIGNILRKEFSPYKHPFVCWEAFRCCGCDYDHVHDAWRYPDIPADEWVKIPE